SFHSLFAVLIFNGKEIIERDKKRSTNCRSLCCSASRSAASLASPMLPAYSRITFLMVLIEPPLKFKICNTLCLIEAGPEQQMSTMI
ncbi:UNVERIFIED_CONTAM: hypothetical protein NCL1_53299, partial [Trichonephila clavipes]